MKRLLLLIVWLLITTAAVHAFDLENLESIGAITNYSRTSSTVLFNCRDNSQIQITILAPDLVRVRASFKKPLPSRDHSWAVAKVDWAPTPWQLKEETDSFVINTGELQVVIGRASPLIEFRDAKTGRAVNTDARPMAFDPKGTAVAATKKLGFDEHFYGLGEKAARLDKRRGQFTMWNSNIPGYAEGTDPIYQSIPFYIGLEDATAYGIFFDNSYATHFDFGHVSQEYASFSADGGEMNYYFFWGPSIKKILGRYADLTGHMPLPPKWALGNQQSRYSYYPDMLAEEVVRRYRKEDLPLDVLHLDIHYMNGYRVFTWDPARFPNPKALTEKLGQLGVKVVTIVDPGVKYQPTASVQNHDLKSPELGDQEKSYYVFNQGAEENLFMKRDTGDLYIGRVWPGASVMADFTLESSRRWWGDLHRAYTENGVAGIWNDMNEPADFNDRTGKTEMNVLSYDEGEYSSNAKNRNVFALLMARATYEGLERLEPNKRPYVITRAAYAGIQRYSTMWTGDNTSTWESMSLSIPMFQTLGLSGEIFVGADVGGFIGRSDGEMLTRWYEIAFLTPFCRNHKQLDSYDHEPWRFGKYYEDIIRKYLKLRYRLMPFLYSSLEEGSRNGVPLFRPLMLNYQDDSNTLNIDDQFMIGSDLLVAPVVRRDLTSRMVYLPAGSWIDYWTGKHVTGGTMIRADAPLETVPMFIRAGAIIPTGPEMNYIGEKPTDPLTFTIYPDENGNASTSLYEDDGTSPEYKKGVFRRTRISASMIRGVSQIEFSAPEGSYNPGARTLHLELKSPSKASGVLIDGKPLAMSPANDAKNSWSNTGDSVTVRLVDDGKAHSIEIKSLGSSNLPAGQPRSAIKPGRRQ
jgi:alpha-glucosidase